MKHAINICDFLSLSRLDPIAHTLINPHVSKRVVEAERGKVAGIGHAVLLTCNSEQADAIITVIRMKYKKYQVRFYESKTKKGWKRI